MAKAGSTTRSARWRRRILIAMAVLASVLVAGSLILHALVSDAQLTRITSSFLSGTFKGEFHVGNVHWDWPAQVELTDMRIASPEGTQAVRLGHGRATLHLLPLLNKRVVIDPLVLEDGALTIEQGREGLTIADAFIPREASPKDPNASGSGVTVRVHNASIARVDVNVNLPAVHASLAQASLDNGALLIDDTALKVTANLSSPSATVRTDTLDLPASPLTLHLRNAGYDMTGTRMVASCDEVALVVEGVSVKVDGRAQLDDSTLKDLNAGVVAQLDTQAPWLAAVVPANLAEQLELAGQLDVRATAKGSAQAQALTLNAEGHDLTVANVSLQKVEAKATHAGDMWRADALHIETAQGNVDADGELSPSHHALNVQAKNIALRQLLAAYVPDRAVVPERLDAELHASGDGAAAMRSHVTLHADVRGLSQAALPGSPAALRLDTVADVTPEFVAISKLTLLGDGAQLTAEGTVPLVPEGPFKVSASFEHPQPDVTLAKLHVPVHASGLSLHMTARGTFKYPEVEAGVEVRDLTATGLPATHVVVPLHYGRGVVRIDGADVQNDVARLVARGTVELQDRAGNWRSAPELDVEAIASKIDLSHMPELALHGTGDVQVRVHGPVTRPRGSASVRLKHVAWKNVEIDQAVALLHSDGKRFAIDSMGLKTPGGGMASLTGDLRPDTGALGAQLKVRNLPAAWLSAAAGSETQLPGKLQADGTVDGTLDALHVVFSAKTPILNATLRANVQPARETIDADLRAEGTLQDALAMASSPVSAKGNLTLGFTAKGDWHAPVVQGNVDVHDLSVQNANVATDSASITVRTRDGAQRAYDIGVDIAHVLDGNAAISLANGPHVDAQVQFAELHAADWLPAMRLRGIDVIAKGGLHAQFDEATGLRGKLRMETLTARVEQQTLGLTEPVEFDLNRDSLRIDDLQLKGAPGSIHVAGLFGPTLNATGDAKLDMGFVSALVPELGAASGSLALDFKAHGPLKDPIAEGKLAIASPLTVRPRNTLLEVRVDEGSIALQRTGVTINKMKGRIGGGTFTLTGDVGLKDLRPVLYNVHLRGSDLPVHTQDMVVEANVVADAIGEGALPLIKGRVEIIRGRYLKKFVLQDFNFVSRGPDTSTPLAQRMPGLRDLKLDITTTSLSGVDVKVDTGAFSVQADIDADLHITGSILNPRVDGKVSAERGALSFPQAKLQLTQAVVDFVPGKGNKLDTTINVIAEGDVTPSSTSQNPTPQTYSVTLKLDGTLDKMNLDLESNPTLGRLDVLTLLTTGHATLQDLTNGSSSSSADGSTLDAALAFAGSQVSGPITQFAEKQLERTLNLRLELGAEVSQDAVRVTAAKSINSRLRLEGAYQVAMSADQSTAVSTRAQLSLTDRLLLEGGALRDLTQSTTTPTTGTVQSSLELKWRLVGN